MTPDSDSSQVSARDARRMWRDTPFIDPRTIDEARLQMVAELHRAMFGDVWARPESPSVVWAELLDRVERAAGAFRT